MSSPEQIPQRGKLGFFYDLLSQILEGTSQSSHRIGIALDALKSITEPNLSHPQGGFSQQIKIMVEYLNTESSENKTRMLSAVSEKINELEILKPQLEERERDEYRQSLIAEVEKQAKFVQKELQLKSLKFESELQLDEYRKALESITEPPKNYNLPENINFALVVVRGWLEIPQSKQKENYTACKKAILESIAIKIAEITRLTPEEKRALISRKEAK